MSEYSKRIKELIRHYVRVTYEGELRRALEPPAAKRDKWRMGSLRSGELSVAIHEFHNGPSRESFKFYNG